MTEETSEEKKVVPPNPLKRFARREFLKRVGIAGTGAIILSQIPGSFSIGVPPSGAREYRPPPILKPEGLPEDVLSEEALKEAHIRIIQAEEVKLHLRKGVFEFQLFKDAKERKIGEVVIVLVDHPNLSWNASEKMPPEIRKIWQGSMIHPSERSEEYWKAREEQEKSYIQMSNEGIELWNGLIETLPRTNPRYYEEKRREYEQHITNLQKQIEEDEQELSILKDRPRAITRAAEEEGPVGAFIHPNRPRKMTEEEQELYPQFMQRHKTLQNDSALKDKEFIIMAFGGKLMPHPSQSYPQPEQFKEWPWIPSLRNEGKEKKFSRFRDPLTAGTTLHHEVLHYQGSDEEMVEEYDTDSRMFESIESAWKKFRETGDTTGYPFVFVTKEGITFTKKIGEPPKSAQV